MGIPEGGRETRTRPLGQWGPNSLRRRGDGGQRGLMPRLSFISDLDTPPVAPQPLTFRASFIPQDAGINRPCGLYSAVSSSRNALVAPHSLNKDIHL